MCHSGSVTFKGRSIILCLIVSAVSTLECFTEHTDTNRPMVADPTPGHQLFAQCDIIKTTEKRLYKCPGFSFELKNYAMRMKCVDRSPDLEAPSTIWNASRSMFFALRVENCDMDVKRFVKAMSWSVEMKHLGQFGFVGTTDGRSTLGYLRQAVNVNKLHILDLSDNSLTTGSLGALNMFSELRSLRLSRNHIQSIRGSKLPSQNLKRLFLDHNQLASLDFLRTVRMKNLNTLDLSTNRITDMGIDWAQFPTLNSLNLSFNRITTVDNRVFKLTNYPLAINLTHNQISVVPCGNRDPIALGWAKVMDLNHNPVACDERNLHWLLHIIADQKQGIQTSPNQLPQICAEPRRLVGRNITTLRMEELGRNVLARDGCPMLCECFIISHNRNLNINCTAANLTKIPNMSLVDDISGIQLHVEHNEIIDLPTDSNSTPTGYDLVTQLYASHNRITQLQAANIPLNMTSIHLDNNQISLIDHFALMPPTLTNLTIFGNPLDCDCDFQRMALNFSITDRCPNGTKITFQHFDSVCSSDPKEIAPKANAFPSPLFLVTATLLIATLFTVVFKFRNRRPSYAQLDAGMTYDVFLCYAYPDEGTIVDRILFPLEKGPPALRVCVHERDWPLGGFIVDAIAETVKTSRRMVFLVTRHFLASRWTRLEFSLAHQISLEESRHRVIIILADPLDVLIKDIRMYEELGSYLRRRKFIKWGTARFWKRLRAAIDASKR